MLTPYVCDDLPDLNLMVTDMTTVKPERTFWDKVIILHGLRQWYDRRAELRHGGQRVSRHYYDLHLLMQLPAASAWLADQELATDCARHAQLFCGSSDSGLDLARRGAFTLAPTAPMREALSRDYDAMAGMVFGDVPALDVVLASAIRFEQGINSEQGSNAVEEALAG
jgi:Nucleotidyl transferase AbiEii toxin, Type IV TA system